MKELSPERFVPLAIGIKLLVSLGIGLLVGFEREWSRKDLGVRTFALVSLLGMLTALESGMFVVMGFAAAIILVTTMNIGNLVMHRELEITTSVALIVVFALGALVGGGHVFTPTASAILMTLLLSLKPQLTRVAGGVTAEEMRGAVLLGLIGFVIYPVLPDHSVDPWSLFNPREAWMTVILISGLGFVNYVLLRLYGTRGLYYTAIFGGLVNSTAAVAELSSQDSGGSRDLTILVTLLTVIAMFVRNLIIVAIFSPAAGLIALWPIAAMCLLTAAFAFHRRPTNEAGSTSRLSSPISFRKIGGFGLFFLAVQAMGTLGQRFFGAAGAVTISFLGGFVSSASATAAAASLAAHGQISPASAAACTVLSCIASTLVNLPLVQRTARKQGALRQLILTSTITTMVGLAILAGILLLKGRH